MRPVALFLFFVWATSAAAAQIAFPPLTGRVVDQAHVLSPATVAELDQKLAAHERATGQQVVVATVSSLQGQTIEDFGYQLGRAWQIGEKDKNTGAILLVAPSERQVRIEVGYGLEGVLTDALSRVIIERDILPRFRAGQMEAGVVQGTDRILAILGGDSNAGALQQPSEPQSDAAFPPIALIIFFLVLMFLVRRRRFLPGIMLGTPTIWRGGSSGGFGSGGSFGGGGGSFGGGGASGRW